MTENYVLVAVVTEYDEVLVQSLAVSPDCDVTDIALNFIEDLASRGWVGKPIAYAAEGGFTADGLNEKMDKFLEEKFPVMVTL